MYVHTINYFRKSIIMKKNCISNVNSEIVLSTYLPKRKCRLTTGYTTRVFSAEVDTFQFYIPQVLGRHQHTPLYCPKTLICVKWGEEVYKKTRGNVFEHRVLKQCLLSIWTMLVNALSGLFLNFFENCTFYILKNLLQKKSYFFGVNMYIASIYYL